MQEKTAGKEKGEVALLGAWRYQAAGCWHWQ